MKKQQTNSSLIQAMSKIKESLLSCINCHSVGKVLSFDHTNNTVSVEYSILDDYNGQIVSASIIEDVPIIFIGNKNARITFNPVGANCLLCFLDRNIDNFLETGEAYFPATSRKHSISDCIAICTFDTDVDTVPLYNANDLSISNKNGNINIYTGASGKTKIYNDSQNLKTILTNLITAIENITVNGTPIDNKSTFASIKSALGGLLE